MIDADEYPWLVGEAYERRYSVRDMIRRNLNGESLLESMIERAEIDLIEENKGFMGAENYTTSVKIISGSFVIRFVEKTESEEE